MEHNVKKASDQNEPYIFDILIYKPVSLLILEPHSEWNYIYLFRLKWQWFFENISGEGISNFLTFWIWIKLDVFFFPGAVLILDNFRFEKMVITGGLENASYNVWSWVLIRKVFSEHRSQSVIAHDHWGEGFNKLLNLLLSHLFELIFPNISLSRRSQIAVSLVRAPESIFKKRLLCGALGVISGAEQRPVFFFSNLSCELHHVLQILQSENSLTLPFAFENGEDPIVIRTNSSLYEIDLIYGNSLR